MPIKALGQAVSSLGGLSRGVSAISCFCGVVNAVLCLFGTRSDRPVEPRSFGFS